MVSERWLRTTQMTALRNPQCSAKYTKKRDWSWICYAVNMTALAVLHVRTKLRCVPASCSCSHTTILVAICSLRGPHEHLRDKCSYSG